jgi:hypothetical protein
MYEQIRFSLEINCDDDDPSRYVSFYKGEIVPSEGAEEDEIGDGPNGTLGAINAYLVHRNLIIDRGKSVFDAMDSVSTEIFEFYEALVNQKTGRWKSAVESIIGEDRQILGDILVIEHVELQPRFCGKGIGAKVVMSTIEMLGYNCAVVACKPFALQHTGCENPEHDTEREIPGYEEKKMKAALRKVRLFWSGLGFIALPNSEIYVLADSGFSNEMWG